MKTQVLSIKRMSDSLPGLMPWSADFDFGFGICYKHHIQVKTEIFRFEYDKEDFFAELLLYDLQLVFPGSGSRDL